MEKKLTKLADSTFYTSRTLSARATWQEGPWLHLFSSPGNPENSLSCQHHNDHSSFYCTRPLPVPVWLSFGLVSRAVDTLCLVRKGYLLPLSFLDFNRWLSLAASEAVPHWTGTMLAGAQETMHFQQTRTGSPLGRPLAHSRRLVNVGEL